jgi:hypothetical protein
MIDLKITAMNEGLGRQEDFLRCVLILFDLNGFRIVHLNTDLE